VLSRILLALCALILPLVLAEMGLRIRGSDVHSLQEESARFAQLVVLHEEGGFLMSPPGARVMAWGYEARINRLGMRDPEPEIPKPSGLHRTLLLGDSVVFGHGLAQDESLPSLLRARLEARDGAGPHDLVSAAVPGWNTNDHARFLEHHIDRLAPDRVVLLYVSNDRELENPFRRARLQAEGWGARIQRFFLVRSRLFEWGAFTFRKEISIANSARQDEIARFYAYRKEQSARPFSPADPGWRESRASLLAMGSMLAERQVPFIVFVLRMRTEGIARAAYQAVAEVGAAAPFAVVDTLPFFEGRLKRELMIQPLVDPHPNAMGHRLLATGIANQLEAMERSLPPRPQGDVEK